MHGEVLAAALTFVRKKGSGWRGYNIYGVTRITHHQHLTLFTRGCHSVRHCHRPQDYYSSWQPCTDFSSVVNPT